MGQKMQKNQHIEKRKCTEAWKFIGSVKKSSKEKVYLETMKPNEWIQYYTRLLREDKEVFKKDLNTSRIEIQGGNII